MSGRQPGCTPANRSDRWLAGRPELIAEIARWWLEGLTSHEHVSGTPGGADTRLVTARFDCSEEEAIRGICVAEQSYWGNG